MDIQEISKYFPHSPTHEQIELFARLDIFIKSKNDRSAFILKGYAGTGKTTVLSAAIKILSSYRLKTILLSPTGRAAKVLASYAGKPAQTIHKKIYWKKGSFHSSQFQLAANMHTNTLFIVDEASMIAGSALDSKMGSIQGASLLDDLISYVYNTRGCRVLFLGDRAQLPPVGLSDSPALDSDYLIEHYQLDVSEFELKEVVRQDAQSGILKNATLVRGLLEDGHFVYPQMQRTGLSDIFSIKGNQLEEELSEAYRKYGIENTLVICRSNKSVKLFNQHIRASIFFHEEEINVNDYVMVARNNYFWLPEDSELGFIANGDMARVARIRNIHEMYGYRFGDAELVFTDYEGQPEISCRVMLSTLTLESPSLSPAAGKELYERIQEDFSGIKNKKERMDKIRESPYYNALQIKFAYAVTCHKAQGGQWDAIFVDQGYLHEEMLNAEFLRWLYTACTRAVQKLYFVNFDKKFFIESMLD